MAEILAGRLETGTLAEIVAVDFAILLRAALPDLAGRAADDVAALAGQGISARMRSTGRLLLDRLGPPGIARLAAQGSDTVRGWACFMIGGQEGMSLSARLAAIRPLAGDSHFGVREWAWLALRPHIAADLDSAFALLVPWTGEPSPYIRRFASEATRPRGVWCRHIPALKADPAPGLVLLEPLRNDKAAYVQDSVGNWLNDAAKTRPDRVRALLARWLEESPTPATGRIARRALRSIG